MKIIKNPWKEYFLEMAANANDSIKITSPFVKAEISKALTTRKRKNTKIELITSFKLMNIHVGSLDLSALENIMSSNGIIKNYPKLHSKIYVFDNKRAVITSGNLTSGGMLRNYEYGVYTDDALILKQIVKDFNDISNDERTGIIRSPDIQTVKNILKKLPKPEKLNIPTYLGETPEENLDVITTDSIHIEQSLSGWKLAVFKCLSDIQRTHFTLNEVYEYENHLEAIYPNNKNIKEKTRQQLQRLRDLGLIEFLGSGHYKKLWKPA